MNISDYSVEGLEEIWDYVDSFFNWDTPKTISDETQNTNQTIEGTASGLS